LPVIDIFYARQKGKVIRGNLTTQIYVFLVFTGCSGKNNEHSFTLIVRDKLKKKGCLSRPHYISGYSFSIPADHGRKPDLPTGVEGCGAIQSRLDKECF
jgi:hypothetical protein